MIMHHSCFNRDNSKWLCDNLNDSKLMPEVSKEMSALNRYSGCLIIAWSIIVICSLIWNLYIIRKNSENMALVEARATYTEDVVYQSWLENHGGMFTEVKDLTFNESSDIDSVVCFETKEGRRFIMVNSVFLTNNVHQTGNETRGIKSVVVGTDNFNSNSLDQWDKEAIKMLKSGKREYSSIENTGRGECLRYIGLLNLPTDRITVNSAQVVSDLDKLNAISVAVPLSKYDSVKFSFLMVVIPVHFLVLFMGILIIALANKHILRYASQTKQAYRQAKEKELALMYQNNEIVLKNRKLDEMHRRIELKNTQLLAFNKLTSGIVNANSEDEFFSIIADISEKILKIPYIAIYSASSAEGTPHTIIQRGDLFKFDTENIKTPCCPLSGVKPDNPLLVAYGNCNDHLCSWAWMPLAVNGQIWGWMIYLSNKLHLFDSTDMQSFLRKFSYQLGAGVQTILLRKNKLEADAQVMQQNIDLTLLNTTKNRFFSLVSHDLKSPFNVILGLSDILRKGFRSFDEEKMKMLIDNLYESTSKTAHLLDNLLEWGRIQLDELHFEPERQNLKSVVDQSMGDIVSVARQKGITIINRVSRKIDVVADPYIARTVFRNLLSNSVKFSYFGGKVWVDAQIHGAWVQCVVTDRGIGIDAEKDSSVFRVDEKMSTTGTYGEIGSGLGLVLCREFIEKHGGCIYLEHPEEGGLRVVFTLPTFEVEKRKERQNKQTMQESCIA